MPVKRCEAGMIMACGIDDLLEYSEAADILHLYIQSRSTHHWALWYSTSFH